LWHFSSLMSRQTNRSISVTSGRLSRNAPSDEVDSYFKDFHRAVPSPLDSSAVFNDYSILPEELNIGDQEIRQRIKESTGFDYDEVILGLKDEPRGLREFERLQTPLPSFLSEGERSVYSKLFRDLIREIDHIKEEVFAVERSIRESSSSRDEVVNGMKDRNKQRMNLESQHVSLILRLSQAEDAYRSLMNSLERGRITPEKTENDAVRSTPDKEQVSPRNHHSSKSNALQEFKKVVEQKKASFIAEQEKAKLLCEETKKEEDEWRKKREEHRQHMVKFTVECQGRIDQVNQQIEKYQKQLIESERRMISEQPSKLLDVRKKGKEQLELMLRESLSQLMDESKAMQDMTNLLIDN